MASRWIELSLLSIAVLFGVGRSGARPEWAMLALFLLLVPPGCLAIWHLRWPGPSRLGTGRAFAVVLAGAFAASVLLLPPVAARGYVLASIAVLGFLIGARSADGGGTWAERWFGLIVLLGIAQALLALEQSFANLDGADPTGTFTNRNHLSGFLNLAIALAFGRLCASVESSPRWFRDSRGLAWTVVTVGATGLAGLAVLRSRSRAGAITLLLVLLLVAGLASLRRRRARRGLSPLIVGAALALVVGLGAVAGFDSLAHRFSRIDENDRPQLYADTLRLIGDQPWLGGGPGMYRWQFREYQTSNLELWYTHAHNDYLEVASDWGVPVAVLLFVWIGWRVLRCAGLYLTAADGRTQGLALGCFGGLTAFMLHGTVDFNLHIPANTLIFALVLGVAASLGPGAEFATAGRETTVARLGVPILRCVVIGLFVAASFAVVGRLRSELVSIEADSVDDLLQAVELSPDSPQAHFRLGSTFRDSPAIQNLERSRVHLQRATELNPRAWRYWWELATLEEVSGDPESAERAFERAIALNPLSGPYRWRWANFLLRRGQTGAMLDQVRAALEIDHSLREPAWSLLQKLELRWDQIAHAWPDDGASRLALLNFAIDAREPVPTAALADEWEAVLAWPEPPLLRRAGLFVDELLERGELDAARAEWSALMAAHRRFDDDFEAGRTAIWNGDFEQPLSRAGLGWRGRPAAGVVVGIETPADQEAGAALRVALDGTEEVGVVLVRQRAILRARPVYRLSYRLRTEERCETHGAIVELRDAGTRDVMASEGVLGSSVWHRYSTIFDGPTQPVRVELILRRARPLRVDTLCPGTVWLDAVRIEPVGG